MNKKLLKHSILLSVVISVILGILVILLLPGGGSFIETILSGALAGILAIYPILLSLINFVFIFAGCTDPRLIRKGQHFEWITLVLGTLYSLLECQIFL